MSLFYKLNLKQRLRFFAWKCSSAFILAFVYVISFRVKLDRGGGGGLSDSVVNPLDSLECTSKITVEWLVRCLFIVMIRNGGK